MILRSFLHLSLLAAGISLAAQAAHAQGSGTASKPAGANTTSNRAAPKPQAAADKPAKPAAAAAKPAASQAVSPAGAPGGGQASLLATYGDWGAYATQAGRNRVCYALSQPKDRLPKTLNRDPGYLFVSFRPGEGVKNEIALMMGFPTKDAGAGELTIGTTKFDLVTKDTNAWVRNPAEETQVVTTMTKGSDLLVKVSSKRGNATTDRYSLSGFTQAIERVRKECS